MPTPTSTPPPPPPVQQPQKLRQQPPPQLAPPQVSQEPLPLPSFQTTWARAGGKQQGGRGDGSRAPQLVPTPSTKPSAFQQLLNFQNLHRGGGDGYDGEGPDNETLSVPSAPSVPGGAGASRVAPAPAPAPRADGSGGAAAASNPTLAAWNAAAAANAAAPGQGQTLDSPVVQLSPQDAAAARAAAVIEARQGQARRLSTGGVAPDEKLPLLDPVDTLREAFGPRATVAPVPPSAHQRIAGIPHPSEGHGRRHRGGAFEKSLSRCRSLNMVEL